MTPNPQGSGGRRGSLNAAMALATDETMMDQAREHFKECMLAPGTVRTKNSMRRT